VCLQLQSGVSDRVYEADVHFDSFSWEAWWAFDAHLSGTDYIATAGCEIVGF